MACLDVSFDMNDSSNSRHGYVNAYDNSKMRGISFDDISTHSDGHGGRGRSGVQLPSMPSPVLARQSMRSLNMQKMSLLLHGNNSSSNSDSGRRHVNGSMFSTATADTTMDYDIDDNNNDNTLNVSMSMGFVSTPMTVEERQFGQLLEACAFGGDTQKTPDALMTLLDTYEQVCADRLAHIGGKVSEGGADINASTSMVSQWGRGAMAERQRHMSMLRQEAATWRLLRALYAVRLSGEFPLPDHMEEEEKLQPMSDKECIRSLFDKDRNVVEAQVVIDWLESLAADSLATSEDMVHYFTDAVVWRSTLHRQQQQKRPGNTMKCVDIGFDPDGPLRRKSCHLHSDDVEDEARLMKSLFTLNRSGKLVQAQDLCASCGQPWRAASLDGWRLAHENPIVGDNDYEIILGNPYRNAWKEVCSSIVNDEELNVYERGLYAALSGTLVASSELCRSVCTSWEDWLWAHYRSMIEHHLNVALRKQHLLQRRLRNNAPIHIDYATTNDDDEDTVISAAEAVVDVSPESIFQSLRLASPPAIARAASDPYHVIQSLIITDDLSQLFVMLRDLCQSSPPNLLRMVVHILLFFRHVGVDLDISADEACTSAIRHYIDHLVESQQYLHIALYTSLLPSEATRVDIYASFLMRVMDVQERQQCLAWGELAGLSVREITKAIVERTTSDDSHDDEDRIRSIEWLCFQSEQRTEALFQSNAMLRSFLARGNTAAASALFDKLPTDTPDVVMNTWSQGVPLAVELALRERLCISLYIDAQKAFRACIQLSAGDGELELSRRNALTSRAMQAANELLRFPGGWLHESEVPESVQGVISTSQLADRSIQLSLLRRECIPDIVCRLHSVLHTSSHYQEAVQLANLVADQFLGLYECFGKMELQRFLGSIHESAVALLTSTSEGIYSITG